MYGRCQGGAGGQRPVLAADLGPENIRVNALSAGPMRTLAGSAIGGARKYSAKQRQTPLCVGLFLGPIGWCGALSSE